VSFAHPWMLLGALAALVPLLIHLFDRRRPRPHPFAAIAFVLKSQKRTASRLKLKRLLLYVLRTLILLALPIALARPELRKNEAAIASRGLAATAVVLDVSMSMRFVKDGKPLFEEAREQARAALRDLLPEEPANLVLCDAHPAPPGSPDFDRTRLRTLLDEAAAQFGTADMTRCVDLALKSLEESPLPSKRIVVISDFAQHAFYLEATAPTYVGQDGQPRRPEVVLRDVGEGEAHPNHAIVDLKVEPAFQVGPRAFQFNVTIRNFSTAPVKNLEAALKVGGQTVAKGFLDLSPGGTGQKTLTHRFESGGTAVGEIVLSQDGLEADNHRPFILPVPKELKALIINGSPHAVRYRDEAFFVEAALTAPGSPVQPVQRDMDSAFKEDLNAYDLVLLLNAPAPSEENAARLAKFVQQGGGLFISMGDQVDPDAYNGRLAAVLPRPLRLVKTAAEREEAAGDTKAARLASLAEDHAVLSPFTGKAREGLVSSRFYRYMLVESDARNASEVLATYEDGAPAVALARRGKGRVLLLTSSVDRDWADFSIRTSFLPFMQRTAAYLCGALEERTDLRWVVGNSLTLHPEPEARPVQARLRPEGSVSGREDNVELEARAQADGSYVVGPLAVPGAYDLLDSEGKALPGLSFVALVDPSESDLTRLQMRTLSAYYGEESVTQTAHSGSTTKTPFWTWLIALATVAFFFEGVLLRR